MPRDALAYLSDVIESCDAITAALLGLHLYTKYFLGYGESLLCYNERSSAFRLGFALYR
jgi:Phospholipase A1